MKMADRDIEEEIKKAQQERLALTKASFGSAGVYDLDIYGASRDSGEYHTSIGVDDDDEPAPSKSKHGSDSRDVVRKALASYSAPKHLLEHRPRVDPDKNEDDDPFKEYKRKTVAEREDEYRARWRKRKLSPPRQSDPFTNQKASAEGRSYKDVMMEQQLEKEKQDVLMKIAKKKKEEEEERRKEMMAKHGTGWDVGEPANSSSRNSSSTTSARAVSSSNNHNNGSRGQQWVINVFKAGTQVGPSFELKPDVVYKIGRDRSSHITLDHPSCSKQHATIQFRPPSGANARPNDPAKPHIMDMGSTNGTFLNDRQLDASKFYEILEGDILKFAGSSREYVFFYRE
jgi:smad nuclear-interacting protein 1